MGRTPSGAPVVFTDKATRHFEAMVALQASKFITRPLDGPIRLNMLIVLPRPKRLMRKKDYDGLVWAPKRPDRDNIEKAVNDGLKLCFRDDAQICAGESLKCYAEKNGVARIIISIEVMTSVGPSTYKTRYQLNPTVPIDRRPWNGPPTAGQE
jgi:Holliday junction resolvase RusA-like endonuclease